ncbi:MAG: NAD-dependent epimerase/dehydratase family protein [Candidatus Hodarchaeota archaeon]
MSKIGIVGGAGFIGSVLATYLSESFRIKILDIKPKPKNLERKMEYQQCDVRRYSDVKHGLKDVEMVIHAAIVQIPLINEAKRLGYEVNTLGTQNVCEVVDRNPLIKGMILTGSWHVIGERELRGVIDEEFGFRPDKVEDRARLYALCKIGQEIMLRVYDEMSEKIYGVIRMGTVLGRGMPEKTAATIFITNGLKGKPITPFKHTMHRPMLYTDVNDLSEAFETYVRKILEGKMRKEGANLPHIVNVFWPEPITILELAETVRAAIIKQSKGKIEPEIEIVDKGKQILFTPEDKDAIRVDVSKMKSFLGIEEMINPKETIEKLVKEKIMELT